jgi:hypothetical protein
MNILDTTTDPRTISLRLMSFLTEHRLILPFAEQALEQHHAVYQQLEHTHRMSDAAVEAWRAALAQRWHAEVTGLRLYKQILRQLQERYGNDALHIQILAGVHTERSSTPTELLALLRRTYAILKIEVPAIEAINDRIRQLHHACQMLEQAIERAEQTEQRRRHAVLDYRMAREATKRLNATTQHCLEQHYGERYTVACADLFDQATTTSAAAAFGQH